MVLVGGLEPWQHTMEMSIGRKSSHVCYFVGKRQRSYQSFLFVFSRQGTADTAQLATLNNCFGFVLGYDLGVSGLVGFAFTGTAADLQSGCKQMFPILDIPPFGLEIGFIDCENPTLLVELTAGLAASAGLPGYTSCTTTAL